jgi:hypothetical protein
MAVGAATGRLKTAEGLMEYSTPQIAGRGEQFRSAIREHLKGPPSILGADQMADTRHQVELDVGVALEYAEAATWTANELVAGTLETAVTGREAAARQGHLRR